MDMMTILTISAFVSIMIGVVLLLKRVFKTKLDVRVVSVLWMLVVIRLCVPALIESPLHLDMLMPGAEQPVEEQQSLAVSSNTSMLEQDIEIVGYEPNVTANEAITTTTAAQETQIVTAPAQTPGFFETIDLWQLAWVVWLIGGSVVLLVSVGKSVLFWSNTKKNSKRIEDAAILEIVAAHKKLCSIRRNINVSTCSCISMPMLIGVIRPHILLPSNMPDELSDEHISTILLHEICHIKRNDIIKNYACMLGKSLHWFNPLVWIGIKKMKQDMEFSCDAQVLALMDTECGIDYCESLLHATRFMKEKNVPQLAVHFCESKAGLKERVIRMVKPQRRSKPAALMALLLAIIMAVVCFTTACQPTPEKPIVVNKADGLSDLIQSTPGMSSGVSPSSTLAPDNDALYEKLAVPKHWNFETTALGGNINITADVDIELPNVSKLPAATASLSEFTQEDLEKIADVLGVRGSEWTEVVNEPSKEKIAQWIIEDKEEIANSDDSSRVEKVKDNLKAHEQMYEDAPYESELVKTLNEFEMSEVEYMEGITGVRFEGTTMINEQPYYFYAGNFFGDSVRTVRANLGSGSAGFYGTYSDEPYEVSLTKEQAAEQAGEIAKQLTDELTLCYVVPTVGQNQEHTSFTWGWACVFMREINGCPTAYESKDVGSSMESEIREPIRYEKMVIVMGDTGMLSFIWENPMTIESIDNPDVTLLSFDEISQRAAAQIGQHWAYSARDGKDNEGNDTSDPGCTAIITKVELGLMRVAKADSDDYYYIPVWNFFTELEHSDEYWERMGEEPFSRDDLALVDEDGTPVTIPDSYPQAWGAVTINALDGSVIDRNLGY